MTEDEDEERHADEVNIAFQMGAEWERKQTRARIEKLEAALKKIALDDPDCCMIADRMRETAEIALGLKND
jgi:hypothetical protein